MAASVAIHGTFLLWPEEHDTAAMLGHEYIVEISSAVPRSITRSVAQVERGSVRKTQPLRNVEQSDSPSRKHIEEHAEPMNEAGPQGAVQSRSAADEAGRESIVRNHLERFKYYPSSARRRGIIGEVEVAFELDAKGQAGMLKVLSASGYRILDDAALETVRRAQPFPADGGTFQFRLHFGAS